MDVDAKTCPFGLSSATAWSAVATATTSTNGLPFPKGSAIFALVISILGGLVIVAKKFWIPGRYHAYVPNVVAFGLSFTLAPGSSQYGLCMAVTSIAAYYWKQRRPTQYDIYAFPIAAGGMAGEGLGGVLNALFVIVGIDGSV